jgi:hypothetical protein
VSSIDYTKLLEKLHPQKDGEDHVSLRTGTVNAVNANGTLDITMSSGVVIPSVPKLATAYAPAGTVVQILSIRGSLLVIGGNGTGGANGPMAKTGTASGIGPTASTSFVSATIPFGVTFPAAPNVHVNLNTQAGAAASWVGRGTSITTTGFVILAYGPSSTFTASWQWTAAYAP